MSRIILAASATAVLLTSPATAEKHTMTMPDQNLTCEDVLRTDIILDDPILRDQYNALRTQCLALPTGSSSGDLAPLLIAGGVVGLLAAILGSSSSTATPTTTN